ncbi:MAG: ComF family protein [Bauldia sp.]|nr:ComF family protein [Bauldia sp.]
MSNVARVGAGIRGTARGVVRLAMPPHCLACDAAVDADGALCPRCWSGFALIDRPYCERLGAPLPFDAGPGTLSPEAIASPPPFGRMRAVALYDQTARRLVQGLKYDDHLDLAPWMGAWMARAGAEVISSADVIVPIPLHRVRLWRRRFNQSAALAAVVGRLAGKPVALDALRRARATRRQVGLGRTERAVNLRGAFTVPPRGRETIAGRSVLLVDDVYTTGATIEAATRVLRRAGAAEVDVLVFARVAQRPG